MPWLNWKSLKPIWHPPRWNTQNHSAIPPAHRCNSYSSLEFRVLPFSLRPALRWKCTGRQHAGRRLGCSQIVPAVGVQAVLTALARRCWIKWGTVASAVTWARAGSSPRCYVDSGTAHWHALICLSALTPKLTARFWIEMTLRFLTKHQSSTFSL